MIGCLLNKRAEGKYTTAKQEEQVLSPAALVSDRLTIYHISPCIYAMRKIAFINKINNHYQQWLCSMVLFLLYEASGKIKIS